ncbi:MAG: zinc ribbon domain-containing protein [Verrucomicrobiae bacterium]|nr:zinc ribbon domain-containing protein [Verrucomicrobiae bacterium]
MPPHSQKLSGASPILKVRHSAPAALWHCSSVPLYEYELCDGNCAACGGRFTLRRPLSAKELTACPACRRPIRKVISSFSTPALTKPLSISDAKKAGFTVLKRVNKGEYERQ